MSDEKLTYLADVEVIADTCETMLKNSKIFEDIAQGNPTLAQKLKDKLKNFIARLKQLLNKTNALTHEGKLLEECVTEFENIQKLWDKTVTDGIKTANAMHSEQKNNTAENSDVKNQLRSTPEEKEIVANIKAVSNMKPVATLSGSEFSKSKTDLVTQVTDYFDEIGGYVNTEYGKIELTKSGVKSSIGHGIGRNKAIAFKAVPDVLKEGKIIDFQKNWKNRGYDTAVFAAPIKIADKDYFIAAVIVVETERNSYYLHEVAIQEKEDNTLFKTGTVKNGTSGKVLSSPIFTLLQKLQSVKNESENNTEYQSRTADIDNEYLEAVKNNDLDNNIQCQKRYVEPATIALEERLQGDELLDAQDIIDTIKSVGGKVDEYGNAILYHGTNKNSRDSIYQSGKMIAKEDGLFFSTKPDGEIKGYGDNIVMVKIPVEYLELNDIFNDEAHFRLPLNSDYSANVSSVLFQMRTNDDFLFDDKINKITQSQQFIRWFGDWQNHPETASKVVDSNGESLVVYHQTKADFTIFNTDNERAGLYDSDTPIGMFFKTTDKNIGLAGNKQMAVYLNAKNVLTFNNRDDIHSYWMKNVPGYVRPGDETVEAYINAGEQHVPIDLQEQEIVFARRYMNHMLFAGGVLIVRRNLQ